VFEQILANGHFEQSEKSFVYRNYRVYRLPPSVEMTKVWVFFQALSINYHKPPVCDTSIAAIELLVGFHHIYNQMHIF